MRTQGQFQQDTPFLDGFIVLLPGADIVQAGGTGSSSFTRIGSAGSGEFSLHCATSTDTYVVMGGASGILYRSGMQDSLQEYFGSSKSGGAQGLPVGVPQTYSTSSTTAGASVSIPVVSSVGFYAGRTVTVDTVASGVQETALIISIPDGTHIQVASLANAHTTPFPVVENTFTTPAGVSGYPPFAGASQLTPVTSARPKGVLINSLTVNYIVGTAAISAQTIGLTVISYANATAPSATTLITNATNGLATAVQSTPHTVTIPVPVANQAFITNVNSAVAVEFDFTLGTSGTLDLLSFVLGCSFNYN